MNPTQKQFLLNRAASKRQFPKSLFSFFILASILAFPRDSRTETKSQLVDEAEARTAAAKAIQRIQHAQGVWYKKETCTSCHHQLLPELTLKLARERGVPVDETAAREATAAALAYLKDLDMAVQGYDYIDVPFDALELTAANLAGIKPSLTTAASAQFIASLQHPDGSWSTFDERPPQAHSLFTATAVCAKAIQQYLPAQFKGEQEIRVRQARAWLLKSPPHTTEDRAFQLFGLLWTGADVNTRQKAARQLLGEQREDGGWAQLPALTSDAYSTGEALLALHESTGLPINDPAYQRGLRFLLKTQAPDGSWRVKSRLHPPAAVSPPYVDTEFPKGHDQFISIMGTSRAVNALLEAIPKQRMKQLTPLDLAPAEQGEWVRVALSGSSAELKKLLDAGMKADAKTAAGTTALMLAVRDPEKVKLLLARGADVNARASTGITALMVAARHRGNAETVRLLLQKGATANAEAKVRNDASALFFAAMAGDVKMAETLVEAGARLGEKMKLIGQFVSTPLIIAAANDDVAMIELLIRKGSNANEMDDDNVSALSWATLGNHANSIQALINGGAKVNHIDNMGMTPLLYAASVDFGDTAVLEKLIAAGAESSAKDKQGRTALDLAKSYDHANAARLLSSKIAAR